MRESDIEKHLVKRVKELGGEVRKVEWVARRGAPDRLVLLPPGRTREGIWYDRSCWVEVKRPGLAAAFPNDEHERAQHREHERMRALGQRVYLIDSFAAIEELLR